MNSQTSAHGGRRANWRDDAQKAARTKLLKVLVRQHDMDDADYRRWLEALTGHTSSKQCTLDQLSQCIDRLKGKSSSTPPSTTESPVAPAGLEAQFGKIAALLQAQGKPWAYAEAIAKRMHRKDRVQFCTGDELRGVIAALVSAGKRSPAQNTRYGQSGRNGQ